VNQARQAKHFHIVLDNLSAQKTKAVEEVLEHNPKARFHFTPTYSWLNQVELWFAKIQRDSCCPRRFHLGRRSSPQTGEKHSRLREIG
jgi:transposase